MKINLSVRIDNFINIGLRKKKRMSTKDQGKNFRYIW